MWPLNHSHTAAVNDRGRSSSRDRRVSRVRHPPIVQHPTQPNRTTPLPTATHTQPINRHPERPTDRPTNRPANPNPRSPSGDTFAWPAPRRARAWTPSSSSTASSCRGRTRTTRCSSACGPTSPWTSCRTAACTSAAAAARRATTGGSCVACVVSRGVLSRGGVSRASGARAGVGLHDWA
jgi:hypothetical protein